MIRRSKCSILEISLGWRDQKDQQHGKEHKREAPRIIKLRKNVCMSPSEVEKGKDEKAEFLVDHLWKHACGDEGAQADRIHMRVKSQ